MLALTLLVYLAALLVLVCFIQGSVRETTLRTQNAQLRQVLREIEWVRDRFGETTPRCPHCGAFESMGHLHTCPIPRLLKDTA